VTLYIGIDPGLTGAIVVLDESGNLLECADIPSVKNGTKRDVVLSALVAQLEPHRTPQGSAGRNRHPRAFACVEAQNARPGQGVSSSLKLGRCFGQIEGLLAGFGIPYENVAPRRWKRAMVRDVEGTDQKARSVLAASRLWPALDLSLKKHHNRAEAALIAEYGRITREVER